MTASSFESFPCRVQLMGLPRSAATTGSSTTLVNHGENAAAAAAVVTPPLRPTFSTLQTVKRNLFGTPDPVEVNKIVNDEMERRRLKFEERYNFDIKTSEDASHPASTKTTSMPCLIEQELRQHEERLQKEECNLLLANSAERFACNETTPPNQKICNNYKTAGAANDFGAGGKIIRRCCTDDTISSSSAINCVERQKPYSRQSLLTERFNLRKNKSYATTTTSTSTSSLSSTSLTANDVSAVNNFLDSHRHAEVLQLPQAIKADLQEDEDAGEHEDEHQVENEDEEEEYEDDEQERLDHIQDDILSCNAAATITKTAQMPTRISLKVVVRASTTSTANMPPPSQYEH